MPAPEKLLVGTQTIWVFSDGFSILLGKTRKIFHKKKHPSSIQLSLQSNFVIWVIWVFWLRQRVPPLWYPPSGYPLRFALKRNIHFDPFGKPRNFKKNIHHPSPTFASISSINRETSILIHTFRVGWRLDSSTPWDSVDLPWYSGTISREVHQHTGVGMCESTCEPSHRSTKFNISGQMEEYFTFT